MSIISIAGVLALGAPGGGGGSLTSPATWTFDSTKAGTADTANYIALFHETRDEFKDVAHGGQVGNINDFRFANDSGESVRCTWKIVKWDGTTGEVVAKVNVGTLTHSTDLVRYVFWDTTSRGSFLGGSTGAIYDSNYKTALGFGDGTTLDLNDETSNGNNGTNHNTAVAAAGISGLGGISFVSTSSQYVDTANTLNIAHPTLEGWVFVPANQGSGVSFMGFAQGNGGGLTDKVIGMDENVGSSGLNWYIFDGGANTVTVSSVMTYGAWHYIVATADGTTTRLYLDGSQIGSQAGGGAYTGYGAPGWQIGGLLHTNGYGTFTASECRLSDTARSASYVTATYNNYSSPSTFYALS